jgi:hypothetical protein
MYIYKYLKVNKYLYLSAVFGRFIGRYLQGLSTMNLAAVEIRFARKLKGEIPLSRNLWPLSWPL